MKKIALIGDSIRMGYEPLIVKALDGKAEVFGPEQNGGPSSRIRENLEPWILERGFDVIYLNCGLHDIRREFGNPCAISLEDYALNLEFIFSQIKEKSSATLIWATITPVNETLHHENKGFDRFEADVLQYNSTATTIAKKFQLEISDLYTTVMQAGRDRLLRNDGVHFLPIGNEVLSKTVLEALEEHLSF